MYCHEGRLEVQYRSDKECSAMMGDQRGNIGVTKNVLP